MMQKLTDALEQSKWTECFGAMEWRVTYASGRVFNSDKYQHIDDTLAVTPSAQVALLIPRKNK